MPDSDVNMVTTMPTVSIQFQQPGSISLSYFLRSPLSPALAATWTAAAAALRPVRVTQTHPATANVAIRNNHQQL